MFWVRIDNRLVHGQIIEAWLPFTHARTIVVANDDLAADVLRQQIVSIAIPLGVEIVFLDIDSVGTHLIEKKLQGADTLVLFASCSDAKRAYDHGMLFTCLNLGNIHYSPGKKQICQHIALSKEDEGCLEFFHHKGVQLDFRCIPSDPVNLSY